MSYRLSLDRPLAEDVVPVADQQLRRAIGELADPEIDVHEGIHQARKRMKKLRGLLRLLRPGLGDQYQAENRRFRDTARRLSSLRDAQAMVEAFDKLRDRYAEPLSNSAMASLRKGLVARLRDLDRESAELELGVEEALQELNAARRRLEDWPLATAESELLADGAKKTYKRARKAFVAAYAEPSAERFHEWRKRAKYHWYHARLLENAWPKAMKARAKLAKELSDLLGDDHDLAVLRDTLEELPERARAQADLSFADGLMTQRQRELRDQALPVGQRLFAEPPGAFRDRLASYLEAARREQAA